MFHMIKSTLAIRYKYIKKYIIIKKSYYRQFNIIRISVCYALCRGQYKPQLMLGRGFFDFILTPATNSPQLLLKCLQDIYSSRNLYTLERKNNVEINKAATQPFLKLRWFLGQECLTSLCSLKSCLIFGQTVYFGP